MAFSPGKLNSNSFLVYSALMQVGLQFLRLIAPAKAVGMIAYRLKQRVNNQATAWGIGKVRQI